MHHACIHLKFLSCMMLNAELAHFKSWQEVRLGRGRVCKENVCTYVLLACSFPANCPCHSVVASRLATGASGKGQHGDASSWSFDRAAASGCGLRTKEDLA